MGSYFLEDGHFGPFVSAMLKATRVIGPVAKKKKFVFKELTHPDELRLDYDVTILPAKNAFFPQWQELVRFAGDRMESCLRPVDQVLFGVHFYEIKAIDMLDEIFRQGHEDRNYLANRESRRVHCNIRSRSNKSRDRHSDSVYGCDSYSGNYRSGSDGYDRERRFSGSRCYRHHASHNKT